MVNAGTPAPRQLAGEYGSVVIGHIQTRATAFVAQHLHISVSAYLDNTRTKNSHPDHPRWLGNWDPESHYWKLGLGLCTPRLLSRRPGSCPANAPLRPECRVRNRVFRGARESGKQELGDQGSRIRTRLDYRRAGIWRIPGRSRPAAFGPHTRRDSKHSSYVCDIDRWVRTQRPAALHPPAQLRDTETLG